MSGSHITCGCIRFDTKVKEAMAKGIAQIVLLGSGLDCRALRLYDPAVTFFELDQVPSHISLLARLQS